MTVYVVGFSTDRIDHLFDNCVRYGSKKEAQKECRFLNKEYPETPDLHIYKLTIKKERVK